MSNGISPSVTVVEELGENVKRRYFDADGFESDDKRSIPPDEPTLTVWRGRLSVSELVLPGARFGFIFFIVIRRNRCRKKSTEALRQDSLLDTTACLVCGNPIDVARLKDCGESLLPFRESERAGELLAHSPSDTELAEKRDAAENVQVILYLRVASKFRGFDQF